MANIIFKRKCKSVPHLRKKIYSKIGNNCLQQQWKTFLTNEQQLNPILHELSKAEFDIRNHDKFKFTARSILIMKREIIRCIQQNALEKGKAKLRELYEKVNHSEMKKIGMMIIYLECKEELEKGLGSGKEQAIICWLKEKMNEHLNGNEISFIKIKILTILSILLLRFHGILMATQEKLIIFKTIELKKKKMMQMDVREQREAEFECLLYLLLELYKILYLLKKDQQTIHFYYNQLHAYTQIYLTRQENKLYLDVNEINKILGSMKPILNDLDIYEDSKLRKELLFAHIQEEIIEQQNQSGKMLEIKKAQQKNRISSSIKISSLKQVRRSSIRDQKLVINHFITKNQEVVKQETIEDVLAIEQKPIRFQFLAIIEDRLFVIEISFTFRNGCNLVDLCLKLKNKAIMLQIFKLTGLQLAISRLTFKNISIFLQKTCEITFKANFYFREMHNLYFADDQLPKGVDFQNVVIAMARIKTQIGQYIKQNIYSHSITGYKFNLPETTLEDIHNYFEKTGKIGDSKPEKMMIAKRQGFILKEDFHQAKSSQISIKILLKRQSQKSYQYYFFNIFFESFFKGIEIYYLDDKDEAVDLTQYIGKLKRISSKLVNDKKMVKRQDVINDMFALQAKIQRAITTVQKFKVQEELQINQQKLKYESIHIKNAKHHQKKKRKINKKPKVYEMIKMDNMKYFLFVKEIRNDYMIYKNQRAKLYLPLNWKQSEWMLVESRLRLYSGIKIVQHQQRLNYFVKTCRQQQSLSTQAQLIVLTFQSHRLIMKASGYSMLLEYKTESNEYLYEIVYNKQQRYYFLSQKQISSWPRRITVDQLVEKYPFKLCQGIRQKISEANWYYINVLKHNHATL